MEDKDKLIAELKAENEKLRELKCKYKEYCTCNTEKYIQVLQEIKEIAEEDCEFCDDIGGCMDNECRKVRILEVITKAESEEV